MLVKVKGKVVVISARTNMLTSLMKTVFLIALEGKPFG